MSFNEIPRILVFVLSVSTTGVCSALDRYCNEVESKGEGHWPISESEFTKQRYDEAVAFLAGAPEKLEIGMDYARVETELVYIEGYLLKASIFDEDPDAIILFCDFVENEAYVRH